MDEDVLDDRRRDFREQPSVFDPACGDVCCDDTWIAFDPSSDVVRQMMEEYEDEPMQLAEGARNGRAEGMNIEVKADGVAMTAEVGRLEPCPFCGSTPKARHLAGYGSEPFWAISCDSDDHTVEASSDYNGTLEEAIEIWNTRRGESDAD